VCEGERGMRHPGEGKEVHKGSSTTFKG
jgi:hypothetical protein